MMMRETLAQAQLRARKALVAADIDGSALDARLLLQAATGLAHEALVADADRILEGAALAQFEIYLHRRLAHEPISRILGRREFYGRDFSVTPDVLDPRADTETVIELALDLLDPQQKTLIDLGTGSGALAITLLSERPDMKGVAVDYSIAALRVAEMNAKANAVLDRLQFVQSHWFDAVEGRYDLIVSNPPYIPAPDIAELGPEVKNHDPLLALDGGPDGMDAYRTLAESAPRFLCENGCVILEIGAGQEALVTDIFNAAGFKLCQKRIDLGGHVRALAFKHP